MDLPDAVQVPSLRTWISAACGMRSEGGTAKTFEQVYREYLDLVAEVNAASVCGLSAKSRVNPVAS
jgi:hypothetical protein